MDNKNNKNIEFLEEDISKEKVIQNKEKDNVKNVNPNKDKQIYFNKKSLKDNKQEIIEETKKSSSNTFLKNINKESIKKFFKKLGKKIGKDFLKFILKLIEIGTVIVCLCCFINWSNDSIGITYDSYENTNIPKSFNNYKILQISDFNNKYNSTKTLISKVDEVKPNIIVITGDYVNADRCDEYNINYELIENLVKKYPIYFVTGEQEQDYKKYDIFKEKIENLGVEVLENEVVELEKDGEKISLIGINDSSFFFENTTALNKTIKDLNTGTNFTVLLAHRPELINIYTENKIPLVLSGHALGGQFNIPFVGPFYSSNQGFYPNFTSGFYKQEDTTIYVSRGIGNTFIPTRLFNNPEINVITLKKGN